MAFNTNGATGAFQGFVPKPQSNTTSNQNMSSIQSALTNAQKTGAVTNVPNRTPQPGLMSPAYSPTGKANFAPAPISTPAPSSIMQPKAPVTTGVANTTPTSAPTTASPTPIPTPAATPATTPTTNITYPGLISSLSSTAQGNKDIAQQAIDTAQKYGAQYADVGQQGAGLRAGQLTTGTSPVGEGNAAITAQTIAAQQQALAQGGQLALQGTGQALTGQAQTQSGLQQAAALAAPIQQPYSAQLINPVTGQPYAQTAGTLQDAVSGVVDKLKSGQMTYDQATQALAGYGQGGINALQQALPQGYNIAQSSALAGQQGTIKPAFDYAKSALTNLQSAVSNLSTGQNTNIPIINQITQGLSTTFGVGSEGVQAYKGAIAEARSAIQKVLASVSGGTPTDYVGQSNALLPDNATPNQIAAAVKTLDTLGQAKVNIYGTPGLSGAQSIPKVVQTKAGAINTNW